MKASATSMLALGWACGAFGLMPTSALAQAPEAAAPAASDEVIVTAQRRSERLVDVPLSVASVSAEEIELVGGASIESLTKAVPGIYLQRDVYGLSPTIRGIGSTLTSSGGEPNVPVYIDGVFVPFKAANIFDLSSISNVQVLKGPQGTLFGRNATGGALLLTTLDPSHETEGRLKVARERFGTTRASGYVSVPFTDQIAANASVSYRDTEGYIRDLRTNQITNDGGDISARVKLLIEPTDDLSIVLAGYHSRFDDPTGSSYQAVRMAPLIENTSAFLGLPISRDRFHVAHNVPGVVQTGSDQYSATVKWETGLGTIQSITSKQKSDLYSVNDLDVSYLPVLFAEFRTDADVFTQELNLTSKSGTPLQYVAGVYYYRNKASTPTPFRLSNVPQYQSRGVTEAVSGYVDGSYDLGNWVIIGGLRYTQEDRTSDTHFFATTSQAAGDRHQEDTEKVWTPRIGLRYELSPDANFYATYTRGYKAGIFDTTSATSQPVDPEFVNAYEVGFKTSAADYTLNTAAYFYDFTDTQVNSFVIDAGTGALFSRTLNANAAEIWGVDLDGTWRFNDMWDVRGALAYTHARYTDFPNAPNYGGTAPSGLLNVLLQDVAGNSMVRAPDWSGFAALNYHVGLGGDMRLDASISGAYSSRVYFDFANERSQGSYVLVDANATLSLNDHLNISVYGQNLTDEIYKRSSGYSVVGTAQTFGTPRIYGVSLGYRF